MIGIIIIVLILYVTLTEIKNGPSDITNSIGIHKSSDYIGKTVDRVEWSLLRENRIGYISRYLMWGLWITFSSSYLFLGSLPNTQYFFRNWILISMILLSLHGFYYWHSDKFSIFNALQGIELIRKKMGLKKGELSSVDACKQKFVGTEAPWNFTHRDYSIGTRYPLDI